MRKLFGGVALTVASIGLFVGSGAGQEPGLEDHGFVEADAAALGITTGHAAGWCEADAGTLGHPDPIGACKK